jgi:GxxExxY protein
MEKSINQITHKIIGCAMKSAFNSWKWLSRSVYQRALAIEMRLESLAFQRDMEIPIYYREILIGTRRVDFFVDECVMLELKARETMEVKHKAQAINYLEAYKIADGLLINFVGLCLEFKRV